MFGETWAAAPAPSSSLVSISPSAVHPHARLHLSNILTARQEPASPDFEQTLRKVRRRPCSLPALDPSSTAVPPEQALVRREGQLARRQSGGADACSPEAAQGIALAQFHSANLNFILQPPAGRILHTTSTMTTKSRYTIVIDGLSRWVLARSPASYRTHLCLPAAVASINPTRLPGPPTRVPLLRSVTRSKDIKYEAERFGKVEMVERDGRARCALVEFKR